MKRNLFLQCVDMRYERIFIFCIALLFAWFINQIGMATALNALAGQRLISFVIPLISISLILVARVFENRERLIFIAVVVLVLLSLITCFNNPIKYETNEYIMYSEQAGYMTLADDIHKDYYLLIGAPHRNLDISFGFEESRNFIFNVTNMPRYFGYDNYEEIGNWLKTDSFIILTENSKERYVTVFSSFDRYTESNYRQIYHDNTVNKVYSNGQFSKFLVA